MTESLMLALTARGLARGDAHEALQHAERKRRAANASARKRQAPMRSVPRPPESLAARSDALRFALFPSKRRQSGVLRARRSHMPRGIALTSLSFRTVAPKR